MTPNAVAPVPVPVPVPVPGARFNPWPWALVAFFVVAIASTATLVTIAVSHRTELVAPDYYDQEMRFQKRLDQLKRTEPWADRVAVRHTPGQGIRVELPREHAALQASGSVELYRPSAAGSDRSFPLALDTAGAQTLPGIDLTPGLWKVRLHWRVANEDYFADRNLVVPGDAARPGAPAP